MDVYLYLLLYILTIIFAYYIFRVVVRKDYQEKGELSNYATVLEFLIFALHANLSYTFLPAPYPEIPPLPENTLQKILGLTIFLIGIFITLWAMSGLGFKKAFGQDTQTLNRYGFYQYMRNPQIVAYGVAILGVAILWFSLYAVGWVLLYAIIAHMMVLTEEEHLLRIYKEDYKKYCEDVPRYIPRLS